MNFWRKLLSSCKVRNLIHLYFPHTNIIRLPEQLNIGYDNVKYLLSGSEMITMLEMCINLFNFVTTKELIWNFNGKKDHLLHTFTQYGHYLDVLRFLGWLVEFDKAFARKLVSMRNNHHRTILHNICEFGKPGSCKDFLNWLVNYFDASFVRDLLRIQAFSESGEQILKYSPLHLYVHNNWKGKKKINIFKSLFLNI